MVRPYVLMGVIDPKMTFGIYHKISPNPSLPKRGTGLLPLWKRGMEGDFSKIIFMLLCEPMAHVDSRVSLAGIHFLRNGCPIKNLGA